MGFALGFAIYTGYKKFAYEDLRLSRSKKTAEEH